MAHNSVFIGPNDLKFAIIRQIVWYYMYMP